MAKIGEKLARLIENQSKVAKATGLSQSAISDAISGKRRLYVDQASLIAKAIGVSLDYLADDALDEPPAADPRSEDEKAIVDLFRALRLSKEEGLRRLAGYGQSEESEILYDGRQDIPKTARRGGRPSVG